MNIFIFLGLIAILVWDRLPATRSTPCSTRNGARLDELLKLIRVIRGEMSLVGSRKAMRLPNPFYECIEGMGASKPDKRSYLRLASYPWRFAMWQLHARLAGPVLANRPETATVILLSYKRIRNIQPIVRSLLKAAFVEKIIVSNHHPEIRLKDWIRIVDDRLHLIDQPAWKPAGFRFVLARQEAAEYFLTIDDDVFFYPTQLKRFFYSLLENPDVPVGIQGQWYVEQNLRGVYREALHNHGWLSGHIGLDGPVHVINRAYAFTRSHLAELFRLTSLLDTDVASMPVASDIVLSFAGAAMPRCVNAGRIFSCPSSDRPGVAVWKEKDFHRERADIYCSLRKLKALPGPSGPGAGESGAD
jgi:hypothetical protein